MNLQSAADLIGVHYQTAYRWVRDGSLTAVKGPSNSYEVTEDEVTLFLARRLVPVAPPSRIQVRDWETHTERFLAELLTGDELAARALVDRLSEGSVSVLELCDNLLAPVLRDIGQRWHDGDVSIAHEHRATAICERILGRISTHPRGRPRGTAVVTTPTGDLHSMPSAMAALALREDRWKIHHLGANVPADDVLALCDEVGATIVVITTIYTEADDNARELAGAVRRSGRTPLVGKPGMTLRHLVEQARAAAHHNNAEFVDVDVDVDVHVDVDGATGL